MDEWAIGGFLIAIVNVVLAGGVTVHAVLWKRDSRAVISWVGLAWLAPFLGAILYLCLGINRIERRAAGLERRTSWTPDQGLPLNAQDLQEAEEFSRDHPNLIGLGKAGQKLTGLPMLPGNHIEVLIDGDQAYPAMIEAIDKAQRSVSLLSYIFDYDRVGEKFLQALTRAHARQVKIRVLIDDVGSKYSRPNMVHQLKAAGLTAESFLPTRIPRLPTYSNLRNHRKILVVDGTVGFTGGTNIREGHCLALQPTEPVQCLHFRLQGPVVSQLQTVFAIDWAFTTGENISGEGWFPEATRAGTVWARGVEHGPDEHFEKLTDLMAAALASARQSVRIVTPYFLPKAPLIQALNVTAMRGVAVEIYVPSASNIALVQWAATAQLWQILEKGCRVYCTPPPFDHTKLMIVDGVWALIGSTNWDPRSLRLNFEFNVECYDQHLAGRLNEIVDAKARSARELQLADVNGRSFFVRLRDGLARLLTPYL
ncbi:MAG TPA: phospholipase [Planctomycetes bacterium]|nr:phospholipase [Fuerstiella sp.]HIK95705.1 phospholipase [Planctomycetota bacterium]